MGRYLTCGPDNQALLFKFDFGSSFLEFFLETLGVSLGETFLDYSGSAVNHFLCFLQSETGLSLNDLNDVELVCTG